MTDADRVVILRRALQEAHAQFRLYEAYHLAKAPPDVEKASRNSEYAVTCEVALERTKP